MMPRTRPPEFPELEKQILTRGITKKQISAILEINVHTLSNKLTGQVDFTLSEVEMIASLFPDMQWEVLFERSKKEQGDENALLKC